MALAFVFVPLGSYFVFDEKLSDNQLLGMTLIITGTAIANRN